MTPRRRPSTSTPSSKWNPWRTKTKIIEAKVTGIGQTVSQNKGCSLCAALTKPKIAAIQLPSQIMKSYLVFISFPIRRTKPQPQDTFSTGKLAQRTQRMTDGQFKRAVLLDFHRPEGSRFGVSSLGPRVFVPIPGVTSARAKQAAPANYPARRFH